MTTAPLPVLMNLQLSTVIKDISGVSGMRIVCAIDGIDTLNALKIIAEVGTDMSRWKSAKHFASWLGVCPGTKISGGNRFSTKSNWKTSRQSVLRCKGWDV